MKQTILFTLILLSISCTRDNASEFNIEENLIVKVALVETIGSDSVWRRHFVPDKYLPPGQDETSAQKLEFEDYRDSIKARLDTARLFVFVTDSLIRFPAMDKEKLARMSKVEIFKRSFAIDTSFVDLILKLSETKEQRHIAMKDLGQFGTYYFAPSSGRQKYNDIISIGEVTLSRAAISVDKRRACIYVEIVCGGECGEGRLMFLEKINSSWTIIESRRMWVG